MPRSGKRGISTLFEFIAFIAVMWSVLVGGCGHGDKIKELEDKVENLLIWRERLEREKQR